ncbi:PAS domain S-box protein [Leptospira idonii]|uniref:histidine kinase n=1 Tax=Leptospira idonii TaxID=1193500 RepID=A0A4R9M257_9LEPT|nr:PAS domain S-box protein [Leptospira idonii]TGN20041.1 PAS domain S-box protein [Leptospira idonii]
MIRFQANIPMQINEPNSNPELNLKQTLELLMINTEESFVFIDRNLKIVTFNYQFKRLYILYFNRDVFEGDNILDYAQEERREIVKAIYDRVLSGNIEQSEIAVPYKDGSFHYFSIRYKPAYNEDGKVIGAFVTTYNQTEQKRSQALLFSSEKRYRALVENGAEGIAILSPKGLPIYISSAIQRILGYTEKECLDEEIVSIIHPEDKEVSREMIRNSMQNPGVPITGYLARMRHKNGSWRWIGATLTNLIDEPTIGGIVQNFRDVTESHNLNREQSLINHIIRSLNDNESVDDSLTNVLHLILSHNDFRFGEAWLVGRNENRLYYQAHAEFKMNGTLPVPETPKSLEFGEGLAGHTWQTQSVEIWNDLISLPFFIRRENILSLGMVSAVGLPIQVSDKTIAVFLFFRDQPIERTSELVSSLKRVAHQIGIDLERKRIVDELNQFFNHSPELICVTGKYGYFKKVNPTFVDLLGYEEKEFYSRPISEFIHPDDRNQTMQELKRNMSGIKSYSFENRYLKKDGSVVYISWHSSEVLDQDGIIFGFGTNITEIKLANQDLLKYKNVLDHSQDGIGILETKENKLYLNKYFIQLLEYTAEEIIDRGGPFRFLYSDQNLADTVEKTLLSGKHWSGDVQLRNKSGQLLDLYLSAGAVVGDSHEILAIYGIHTDIRERKKYEEDREKLIRELTRNNHDLKQFAYITSHNLRAPLSNLTGLILAMENIPQENPLQKEILSGFKQSTNLLSETIDDLIKILIIRDNPSVEKEILHFEDILSLIQEQIKNLFNEHKPNLSVDFSRAKTVFFNKSYLESILLNLFTNAMKYKNPKVPLKIDITAYPLGKNIVLEFQDNGLGIDLVRHKDKIFGLYQRFHNHPDSKGLGLYLVKSQIQTLGGDISVEGNVNQGLKFTILFPEGRIGQ